MSLEIPDDLIDSCDVINDGENCKNIDVESEKTFKISILHLVSFVTVFNFSKSIFFKFISCTSNTVYHNKKGFLLNYFHEN